MSKDNCQIFVDADACPVKGEIEEVASKYGITVKYIASYNHAGERSYGEWIYVDAEKEAVDLYIINHSKPHDIVITQDIGLAGLLLPKNVYVISPRGKLYDNENIISALEGRYLSAKERRSGHRVKGPAKFTAADRSRFFNTFDEFLSKDGGFFL